MSSTVCPSSTSLTVTTRSLMTHPTAPIVMDEGCDHRTVNDELSHPSGRSEAAPPWVAGVKRWLPPSAAAIVLHRLLLVCRYGVGSGVAAVGSVGSGVAFLWGDAAGQLDLHVPASAAGGA